MYGFDALPETDEKSRAILDQMRSDEAEHGEAALEMGGQAFPEPIRQVMTVISRLMTESTYRI